MTERYRYVCPKHGDIAEGTLPDLAPVVEEHALTYHARSIQRRPFIEVQNVKHPRVWWEMSVINLDDLIVWEDSPEARAAAALFTEAGVSEAKVTGPGVEVKRAAPEPLATKTVADAIEEKFGDGPSIDEMMETDLQAYLARDWPNSPSWADDQMEVTRDDFAAGWKARDARGTL